MKSEEDTLVSVHGVCHIGLMTDGVNGSWLCQEIVLATRKRSEETDIARQELGKGQRAFRIEEVAMGRVL